MFVELAATDSDTVVERGSEHGFTLTYSRLVEAQSAQTHQDSACVALVRFVQSVKTPEPSRPGHLPS